MAQTLKEEFYSLKNQYEYCKTKKQEYSEYLMMLDNAGILPEGFTEEKLNLRYEQFADAYVSTSLKYDNFCEKHPEYIV